VQGWCKSNLLIVENLWLKPIANEIIYDNSYEFQQPFINCLFTSGGAFVSIYNIEAIHLAAFRMKNLNKNTFKKEHLT
jgi:hypothetical protein